MRHRVIVILAWALFFAMCATFGAMVSNRVMSLADRVSALEALHGR